MRTLLPLALLAALTLPTSAGAALLPQNDAGSGTDAPNTPTPAFRVAPGVVHLGTFEGRTTDDHTDWYAFTAPAGAALDARVAGAVACISLHDATGAEISGICSIGFAELGHARGVAATAGTYYVQVTHTQPTIQDTVPQTYRFSVGVGAAAPAPTPVTTDLVPTEPPTLAPVAPASQADEHVVVAVVDTGINPYHDFFAAPALADHPSGWLPGFPAAAMSVDLSLDETSYADAIAADATTWAGLQRSRYDEDDDSYDAHLYTFPGTRVVAGVSFGEYDSETGAVLPVETAPVRDDYGHGTHSAGLAAGANLIEADGNVLIVAVEVPKGGFVDGIRWAARQPWIDAITISLGQVANVPVTFSPTGDRTGPEWATLEANTSGKPVFNASGNGVSNSGITPDHCTTYTSPYTGPAWVTRIGAAEDSNGNPTWWHCVPVEAIARTDVDSPSYDDTEAASSASGTSAATPNAAGHWAHLMLAGRRNGSSATRLATLDYLLHAAAPAPLAPGANDPSVYPLSLADQGYGLIDQAALDAATTRLLAGSGPAPRPETTDWFERDKAIRTALWGPGSATENNLFAELPQDDAGTATDAPDERDDTIVVSPGVRYEGYVDGSIWGDFDDWYAFDGNAGEVVSLAVASASTCYEIVSATGTVAASSCGAGYAYGPTATATLSQAGTWFLHVNTTAPPQPYSFGFGVNGPPPAVFL